MNVKNLSLVAIVVVAVTVIMMWVAKMMWEPNGMFITCVGIDPVSFVGLVLGVIALTLAVNGRFGK